MTDAVVLGTNELETGQALWVRRRAWVPWSGIVGGRCGRAMWPDTVSRQ